MSSVEAVAVIFSGIAAIGASVQAFVSYSERGAFAVELKREKVLTACADVVSSVSEIAETVTQMATSIENEQPQVNNSEKLFDEFLLSYGKEIGDFRTASATLGTYLEQFSETELSKRAKDVHEDWVAGIQVKGSYSVDDIDELAEKMRSMIPVGIAECKEITREI